MLNLLKVKPVPDDGQMELMEHLAELRTRIFRAVLFLIVGMVLTFSLFPLIFEFLSYPIESVLKDKGFIVLTNITDAFLLRLQICFVSGLIVSFPFVIMELWGFIAPALNPNERRPVVFLAPFSFLLFLAGVGTGYACLPVTYEWMGTFINDVPGAQLMQNAQAYVLLTLKILLGFGISFQMPIILLFLARVGIITADLMVRYWRHAVVGCSVFAAVLTPSADPLTMLMMGVPLAGLYLLSIGLVRAFEPREDGTRRAPLSTMILVALAPVAIIAATGFWLTRTHHESKVKTQAAKPAPAVPTDANLLEERSLRELVEQLRNENILLKQRLDAIEAKVSKP
ncbi:MAG: twin-arginine translocase subunit TatC [Armatimonadaceae bacterium]